LLPLIAFVFLLVYHRIALLASTYSRAKGVCLFSFIVPELDRATYVCHDLLTKLGVTLGAWPETGARYPLPRLRDVCWSGSRISLVSAFVLNIECDRGCPLMTVGSTGTLLVVYRLAFRNPRFSAGRAALPAHRIAAGWIKCEQTSFSRCG
jgi:hypothetical protein